MSGKRDSNPRPPAWKASALSTELFPQITLFPATPFHVRSQQVQPCHRKDIYNKVKICGCGWIRTTEVERQQIYSLPHLAALEHTQDFKVHFRASSRTRTNDRWITNLVLYQLSYRGIFYWSNSYHMNSPNESECKSTAFFSYDKIFLQKNSKKTHFFIF